MHTDVTVARVPDGPSSTIDLLGWRRLPLAAAKMEDAGHFTWTSRSSVPAHGRECEFVARPDSSQSAPDCCAGTTFVPAPPNLKVRCAGCRLAAALGHNRPLVIRSEFSLRARLG